MTRRARRGRRGSASSASAGASRGATPPWSASKARSTPQKASRDEPDRRGAAPDPRARRRLTGASPVTRTHPAAWLRGSGRVRARLVASGCACRARVAGGS
jgi:hypothetical protein